MYCGNINLPPTSGPYPYDVDDKIYHYQGCCHKYDAIIKENRKVNILCKLYELKINGWKCPHSKEYYDQLTIESDKKHQESMKDIPIVSQPPSPLIFRWEFPRCCELHFSNKIHYEYEDVLNDPETIEKFKQLYPNY